MEGDELASSLDGSETSEDVSEEDVSWVQWFISIKGNELFCEVDEDYIHDEFNLTGLSADVPYFEFALDTILDVDSPNGELRTGRGAPLPLSHAHSRPLQTALVTFRRQSSPAADLLTEEQQETVDAAAELLYGLIHARYILTTKGLNAMVRG
jgi:casein kinase II subunit beta